MFNKNKVLDNQYPCVIGSLSAEDWDGQTVFVFGDTAVDRNIPSDRVWRIENPSPEALTNIRNNLQVERLLKGVMFVLPQKANGIDMASVQEIQKIILHLHYKYVYFPNKSHATADPAGVRKETIPDVIRAMNQLRNYPWLASAPLIDKFSKARFGMPVMLLMPGPSIKEIRPYLKDIRKHCLIACIARTLSDCMESGVVPDIVIQLDTYHIQQAFYENLPDMPETLLMPISICPFYPYAEKFRGVVMMDSFNTELLPNPARLRESYVSSLTACLGLAEALHAPDAFIAGANLSSKIDPSNHPYSDETPDAYPVYHWQRQYLLSTQDNSIASSKDWYIATATEADQFAEIISTTSGTRFHSTTKSTLLSKQWFPHIDVDAILARPEIDRQQFLDTIDDVLAVRENIDLTKTRMFLLKQLNEIRQVERTFSARGQESTDEFLNEHILTKAARKMRNPYLGPEVDAIGVAAKLVTNWREDLNNARLLIQGMTNATRKKPIPLLCFSGEIESLETTLKRIIPDAQWDLFSIATSPYPPFDEGTGIPVNEVLSWLRNQQVVFVSPQIMKSFPYILDYAPDDNIYDLRLIFRNKA